MVTVAVAVSPAEHRIVYVKVSSEDAEVEV
jgi:hypothetical protein